MLSVLLIGTSPLGMQGSFYSNHRQELVCLPQYLFFSFPSIIKTNETQSGRRLNRWALRVMGFGVSSLEEWGTLEGSRVFSLAQIHLVISEPRSGWASIGLLKKVQIIPEGRSVTNTALVIVVVDQWMLLSLFTCIFNSHGADTGHTSQVSGCLTFDLQELLCVC